MVVAMSSCPWRTADLGVIFLMWVVMMVGLMLPGSVPMIFLFSTINRKMHSGSLVPAGLFVLGCIALDML